MSSLSKSSLQLKSVDDHIDDDGDDDNKRCQEGEWGGGK